ncbi:MAG: type II secretion system F family protein [Anaerolineae bacterium]|nr:type II secretion system F family protein [Anaerolineae bacterium]
MALIISLIIFFAILSFFIGTYHLAAGDSKIESRLEMVPNPTIHANPRRQSNALTQFLNRELKRSGFADKIAIDLTRANLKLTVAEYIGLNISVILIAFFLGILITRRIIPGVALAIVGAFLPRLYVRRRQSQRLKAFQDQLPDTLNLLVSSLKSGYGFLHAIEMVAQEMPEPSAEEFSKVVRETALGYSLPEALGHLVQRVGSDDLELAVTAINVQHEVGGNLAEILETISETIQARVRLKGEIAVMTTQQRMTGLILSGMPFILGTLLMLVNPEYMMVIFQRQWLFIPGGAIFMMVLGNLFMRRILSQEF